MWPSWTGGEIYHDRHPIPALKEALTKGQRMVLLAGPPGTGKTMAAVVALGVLGGGAFIRANRYVTALQSFRTAWEAERAGLRTVLVLDEVGEEQDRYAPDIGNLLAERYDMACTSTTMVTTNLAPKEFAERYGERVASRFRDPRYAAILACKRMGRPTR